MLILQSPKLIQKLFLSRNNLVFCNNFCSDTEAVGHLHDPVAWRLFIDSSKVSLKAMFLHIGNKFPSVPLAHAANTEEPYDSIKLLFTIYYIQKFARCFVNGHVFFSALCRIFNFMFYDLFG